MRKSVVVVVLVTCLLGLSAIVHTSTTLGALSILSTSSSLEYPISYAVLDGKPTVTFGEYDGENTTVYVAPVGGSPAPLAQFPGLLNPSQVSSAVYQGKEYFLISLKGVVDCISYSPGFPPSTRQLPFQTSLIPPSGRLVNWTDGSLGFLLASNVSGVVYLDVLPLGTGQLVPLGSFDVGMGFIDPSLFPFNGSMYMVVTSGYLRENFSFVGLQGVESVRVYLFKVYPSPPVELGKLEESNFSFSGAFPYAGVQSLVYRSSIIVESYQVQYPLGYTSKGTQPLISYLNVTAYNYQGVEKNSTQLKFHGTVEGNASGLAFPLSLVSSLSSQPDAPLLTQEGDVTYIDTVIPSSVEANYLPGLGQGVELSENLTFLRVPLGSNPTTGETRNVTVNTVLDLSSFNPTILEGPGLLWFREGDRLTILGNNSLSTLISGELPPIHSKVEVMEYNGSSIVGIGVDPSVTPQGTLPYAVSPGNVSTGLLVEYLWSTDNSSYTLNQVSTVKDGIVQEGGQGAYLVSLNGEVAGGEPGGQSFPVFLVLEGSGQMINGTASTGIGLVNLGAIENVTLTIKGQSTSSSSTTSTSTSTSASTTVTSTPSTTSTSQTTGTSTTSSSSTTSTTTSVTSSTASSTPASSSSLISGTENTTSSQPPLPSSATRTSIKQSNSGTGLGGDTAVLILVGAVIVLLGAILVLRGRRRG